MNSDILYQFLEWQTRKVKITTLGNTFMHMERERNEKTDSETGKTNDVQYQ